MNIDFNLQTPDGKSAAALAKIIEARTKELGETTRQACTAVASNILRSLRAQTKVAKSSEMEITVTLADDKYFPSFKRDKGSKGKQVSKRVLRDGKDGPVVKPDKVVWRVKKYFKGQVVHSYEVEDRVSQDKSIKYIIVTESSKSAERYAKQFHRARVKQHSGLAKLAISLAMKGVYDKGNSLPNSDSKKRGIAEQNVNVSVSDSGFNEGEVNIHVHDKLDYATLAFQNKENSVNAAIQNAVNRVFGYIQQRVKANGGQIDQSLKMTVDEMNGANI
jgi:hypothetical protein